jgi:TPR repeat protein
MELRTILLACSVAMATPAIAATPTVKAGVEAWQRGDHAGAVAIWRNLAEKGDADAAFNLGQAYRLGRGVPSDSSQAKKWFEVAANKGHVDAQVSLGLLLFDSGDRATAMNWLQKAAEKGEPRALLVIGTCLVQRRRPEAGPDPRLCLCQPCRGAGAGARQDDIGRHGQDPDRR